MQKYYRHIRVWDNGTGDYALNGGATLYLAQPTMFPNHLWVGIAKCHPDDRYVKEIGRKAAQTRAKLMEKEEFYQLIVAADPVYSVDALRAFVISDLIDAFYYACVEDGTIKERPVFYNKPMTAQRRQHEREVE